MDALFLSSAVESLWPDPWCLLGAMNAFVPSRTPSRSSFGSTEGRRYSPQPFRSFLTDRQSHCRISFAGTLHWFSDLALLLVDPLVLLRGPGEFEDLTDVMGVCPAGFGGRCRRVEKCVQR